MREKKTRTLEVVDEREPGHEENDQRDEQQLDPDRDAYQAARLLGPLSALVTVRGVFHQRSVAAVARGLDGHAWSIGRHSPGVPAKPASWGGSPGGPREACFVGWVSRGPREACFVGWVSRGPREACFVGWVSRVPRTPLRVRVQALPLR